MATIKQRGNSYKITARHNRPNRYAVTDMDTRAGMTKRQIQRLGRRCCSRRMPQRSVLINMVCRVCGKVRGLRENSCANDHCGYRWALKRTCIGHIQLDKLRPHHLMAFYDNLAESGIRKYAVPAQR
ncbi:MAG: hypothetical protein ACLSGI_09585 [Butyricicoccaceae bacterium]